MNTSASYLILYTLYPYILYLIFLARRVGAELISIIYLVAKADNSKPISMLKPYVLRAYDGKDG